MSIRLDWEKLKKIHSDLTNDKVLKKETDLVFIMVLHDGSVRKSIVKFKDFLNFFWDLADNPNIYISALVVQDKEGRTLYRHKLLTAGMEEIPNGGNINVVLNWVALTAPEKETYLKLLIAQIQSYEQ